MSSFSRTIVASALVGAAMLSGPLTVMAADSSQPVASQVTPAVVQPAPKETVEQRIASLHASLGITAHEEADWNGVAKAMRANAAIIQKLVAERSTQDPAAMTAVDDLVTYGKFARAHAEGLRSLTTSFRTLYNAMPDAQKKVADGVFQNFDHEKSAAHS